MFGAPPVGVAFSRRCDTTRVFATLAHKEARFMQFSKIVFRVAGVWGILVLAPLYFLYNAIGVNDPPPITHPGFFYAFVGAGLAWQFAFFIIAQDPARYRPLMLPSIFEKWSSAGAWAILFLQGRIDLHDLLWAGADSLLGLLFLIAFFKSRAALESVASARN
jgi:hypothetical protein